MSFWSLLGLVSPPHRLTAYHVDPVNPAQAIPIGTIPALPEIDVARIKMEHNPAHRECVRDVIGSDVIVAYFANGTVEAVCFEAREAATNYPGYNTFTREELNAPYKHFCNLAARGGHIFDVDGEQLSNAVVFHPVRYRRVAA